MSARRTIKCLDKLSLGERIDGIQEIDAHGHGAIAEVVVKMSTGENDYEPGVELSKRIVAIPTLMKALQSIASDQNGSIYDLRTIARDALADSGVSLE